MKVKVIISVDSFLTLDEFEFEHIVDNVEEDRWSFNMDDESEETGYMGFNEVHYDDMYETVKDKLAKMLKLTRNKFDKKWEDDELDWSSELAWSWSYEEELEAAE